MDKIKLYQRALQHYGYDAQLAKLAEEASELSAAAARNLLGNSSERPLAEEMADVEIMIEQFRLNGMADLIDHIKQQKLVQLAQRVGFGGTSDGLL